MSYNYTQLHEIIEMQYKVSASSRDNRRWFLDETAKLVKGYTKPTTYINTLMTGNKITTIQEEPPIYIDQ